MRIGHLAVALVMGAGVSLGAAGCGVAGSRYYEDCEVTDQFQDGDLVIRDQRHEADCGYWEHEDGYYTSEEVRPGAIWHWWSWVVVGQDSYAPSAWKPPHGLKPPLESSDTERKRKAREKQIRESDKRREERDKKINPAPTGARNGNSQPRTGSGNQGIPKNNPAPAAPAAPKPAKK